MSRMRMPPLNLPGGCQAHAFGRAFTWFQFRHKYYSSRLSVYTFTRLPISDCRFSIAMQQLSPVTSFQSAIGNRQSPMSQVVPAGGGGGGAAGAGFGAVLCRLGPRMMNI